MRIRVDGELTLRSVESADADTLFLVVDGHRAHLGAWLPWVEHTVSVADTRAFIALSRENEADGTGLAALIEARGELCGCIGLDAIDRFHRASELGYWLREDCQGRGLATRSAAALIGYAFSRRGLDLNRLGLRAAPDNHRSRALARRLGFREEGVLREAQRRHGRYSDLVLYSLLRGEYEARSP